MKNVSRVSLMLGLLLIGALATFAPSKVTAEEAVKTDFSLLEKYSELIKSWHEEEQSDQEDEGAEQPKPIDLIARLIALPSGEVRDTQATTNAKVDAIIQLEELLGEYDTEQKLDLTDISVEQAQQLLDAAELLQLPPDFSAQLIAPLATWLADDFQAKINSPELKKQLARFTGLLGGDEPTQEILAPWNVSAITSQTLTDHTYGVNSVAFSPDGKYLATGSVDYTAKIWDVKTGTCIQTLTAPNDHTDGVTSVAFSPDGKYLATGSWDNTAKIWDVATGTCIQTLTAPNGHTDIVFSVAFSPDGRYLATGSRDQTAKIWDVASGTCIKTLTGTNGHTNGVHSVAFSPNGKYLATGSWDKTAKIWDVATGTCIQTLTAPNGHTNGIKSVAFSPDGKYLATGYGDTAAKIWDVDTGTCIKTLTGHRYWVTSVAFSPDGHYLATGSEDHTARIWRRIGNLMITPAEKIIYEAFQQSSLKSVTLYQPLSYGAQIIKKLNSRSTSNDPIIPEKTMSWGTSALGELATWWHGTKPVEIEN